MSQKSVRLRTDLPSCKRTLFWDTLYTMCPSPDIRDKYLHSMFVQNFDSQNDIVECLNSRIIDPSPKLPIHTILNFYRVTCSSTIEKSGQPSGSINASTSTSNPTTSQAASQVATAEIIQQLFG